MEIQNSPNFVTIKTLETDLRILTSHTYKNLITIKTLEPEININEDLFISSDSDSSIEDKTVTTSSRASAPCLDENFIDYDNPELTQNESKTGSLLDRLATAGITRL